MLANAFTNVKNGNFIATKVLEYFFYIIILN